LRLIALQVRLNPQSTEMEAVGQFRISPFPIGDHALLDLNRFQGMIPKQVTVRTKSRDSLSSDSIPIPISPQVLRGRRPGRMVKETNKITALPSLRILQVYIGSRSLLHFRFRIVTRNEAPQFQCVMVDPRWKGMRVLVIEILDTHPTFLPLVSLPCAFSSLPSLIQIKFWVPFKLAELFQGFWPNCRHVHRTTLT